MNDQNDVIVSDKKLVLLDHTRTGPAAEDFYDFAKTRFVGEPRMAKWLAQTTEIISEGFYPEKGPIASVLFVGPSGVGKTFTAPILSEFLFGNPKGFTTIRGEEMRLEHNIACLTGAPPGYVGHGEPLRITQEKLDRPAFLSMVRHALREASEGVREEYYAIQEERSAIVEHIAGLGVSKADDKERETARQELTAIIVRINKLGIPTYNRKKYVYPSVLLLDEIEKGHPTAYPNSLFQVLDDGTLSLTSNKQNGGSDILDFRKTIIIATSNLGEEELKKLFRSASGRSTGYRFTKETYTPEELDRAVYRVCRDAVDNFFSTPFLNRFGDIIVARPHTRENQLEILDIELNKLRSRLFDPAGFNFPIMLQVDEAVRQYLVDEIADKPEKGIRFLQQKLKKSFSEAIVNLKATEQVNQGDILHVSLDPTSQSEQKKKLLFQKEDAAGRMKRLIVVE